MLMVCWAASILPQNHLEINRLVFQLVWPPEFWLWCLECTPIASTAGWGGGGVQGMAQKCKTQIKFAVKMRRINKKSTVFNRISSKLVILVQQTCTLALFRLLRLCLLLAHCRKFYLTIFSRRLYLISNLSSIYLAMVILYRPSTIMIILY